MVTSSKLDQVDLLKRAIQKAQFSGTDIPASCLKLYKISTSDNELVESLGETGTGQLLSGGQLLETVFCDLPFSETPHVVIECISESKSAVQSVNCTHPCFQGHPNPHCQHVVPLGTVIESWRRATHSLRTSPRTRLLAPSPHPHSGSNKTIGTNLYPVVVLAILTATVKTPSLPHYSAVSLVNSLMTVRASVSKLKTTASLRTSRLPCRECTRMSLNELKASTRYSESMGSASSSRRSNRRIICWMGQFP